MPKPILTRMLTVEKAREIILRHVNPLPPRTLVLEQALGCVLAADLPAPISLQPFDNSAVDGFAVRAQDVRAASRRNPIPLRQREEVAAGCAPRKTVHPGQTSRIFTGAPIPKGADAVVMQEDAQRKQNTVLILAPADPGENIRRAGEDVRAGEIIGTRGQILEAGLMGLLAALGLARVPVIPRPRVGMLVNGNELVPPGKRLRRGQIYNSNSVMLAALVRRTEAEVINLGVAADRRAALRAKIREALRRCDALVTVGGVSVGKYDLVKPVLEELGAELKFWKVAMKPGKPLVFGMLGHLPVFGLPGNPVSAFATFLLLVRPAILKLRGLSGEALPSIQATMGEAMKNLGDRRHFLRVRVGNGIVRSAGRQGSHVLSSLAAANGLLDLAAGERVRKGQRVHVERVA